MRINLNLAICGNWPGAPDDSLGQASMHVRSVTVRDLLD